MYKSSQTKNKLYFGVIEFNAATQLIARDLQVTQVPLVAIVKKHVASDKPTIVKCDLSREQVHDFIFEHTGLDTDMTEEDLMKIMAQDETFKKMQAAAAAGGQGGAGGQQQGRGGPGAGQGGGDDSDSKLNISQLLRLGWQISFIAIGSILLLVCLSLFQWVGRTIILSVVAWIAYIICQGGIVYNMIHNTGPYQYNPYTGQTTYLYPEMRGQFSLEGYMATACMVIGGACIIATTQLVPLVKQPVMKRVVALLLVTMFWLSFGTVFVWFSLKMGGYLHGSDLHKYVALATHLFGR